MRKIAACVLLCYLLPVQGQTIQMEFPHFAGNTYDFIIFQGDKQLKVQQDTIPPEGKFTLKIPQEYMSYTGMSRWLLTNSAEGGGLDMPIDGKNFSVSCTEKNPTEETILYKGNDDASLLNLLFREQQGILNKADAVNSVLQVYDKSEKNYPVFEQEYDRQQQNYTLFQQKVKNNPSYAAKVFNIFGLTMGIGNKLSKTEKENAANIVGYIANDLDFEILYTSGHWTGIIASWVDTHTQVLQDKEAFASDFAKIEKKIESKKLFTDFAGRVAYFLSQRGKDDYIAAIASIVKKSGKIEKYEGSMKAYLVAGIGSQAPDILLLEHVGDVNDHNHKTNVMESKDFSKGGYQKTLVIFYESGCGPCDNLLQQLPGNYEDLKKKGIRIITISADTDKEVFKSKADSFPWKDNYCDYQGKEGINFQNYGVTATPTMFLLDKTGKIEARMAGLDELLNKLE